VSAYCFLDTNILLYAHDEADENKAALAGHLIAELGRSRSFTFSIQVLNEYYNVAIGKPGQRDKRDVYRTNVVRLSAACTAPLDMEVLRLAWSLQDLTNYAWWDLLIIASAQKAGCRYLLTEDMHHGQEVGELTIVNPFFADLDELFMKLDIPPPLFPIERAHGP
jgi:predicted nucleic acid-binding protein